MRTHSLEYLLAQVNKTAMMPSAEAIRISVMDGVRHVFRRIGINLLCGFAYDEEIDIVDHKYHIPSRIISIEDVFQDRPESEKYVIGQRNRDISSYKVSSGLRPPKMLSYRESPLELYFPHIRHGNAYMSCYYLYEDEDGELIIPEIAYMACLQWCSYFVLDQSMNPKNPRWQERLIMKQQADQTIVEARGNLNETKSSDHRTARILR